MRRPLFAALLLGLIALLFPSPSIASPTAPPIPPIQANSGAPQALRQGILRRLQIPDAAILTLTAGTLLILLECNLPGAILPGAFGLLLLLLGAFGLSLHPLQPKALFALVAATALLALSGRKFSPVASGLAGTGGLIYGLAAIIAPAPGTPLVHLPVATAAGLLIGASASVLNRIAARARRNKISLPSGHAADLDPASWSPPEPHGPRDPWRVD